MLCEPPAWQRRQIAGAGLRPEVQGPSGKQEQHESEGAHPRTI